MSRSSAHPPRSVTSSGSWHFWIDRGGTFTDIVAACPDGSLVTRKLLSNHPEQYDDAAIAGIRQILDSSGVTAPIAEVKMGTTVGTNALLERKGEPVVLAITRGFADALRIGYQNRPDIFALRIVLPTPLYERTVEIDGRIDATGLEREPLDGAAAETQLAAAYREGYRSLAIVLMHAWCNSEHERALAHLARRIGYTHVSVSHRVSPAIRLIGRGDTTVVDAYLTPLLKSYVQSVVDGLKELSTQGDPTPLLFMQSNGGLTEAAHFHGRDSLLSGPAGGLIGAATTSRLAGFSKIIAFDMGGTSTDVAHYSGTLERNPESDLGGIRLQVPMLNIHTVAAGGGSILHYDGLIFRVGPDSAGADPGPTSYRRGGPLCVTDANVMLGKLRPEFFPRVLGPRADQPLDGELVKSRFQALAAAIEAQSGRVTTPEAVAEGFIEVAVEQMAGAIRKISIQRGHDLANHALCSFGAAAGQHACRVADRLGIKHIIIHPLAGVLSAYGVGLADQRLLKERAVVALLEADRMESLAEQQRILAAEGLCELRSQMADPATQIDIDVRLALRYQGTDTLFEVGYDSPAALRTQFERRHRSRFGFIHDDKPLLIESLIVELIARQTPPPALLNAVPTGPENPPRKVVTIYTGGRWLETPVHDRSKLCRGQSLAGPALVLEANSTTFIEPGWEGYLLKGGELILKRISCPKPQQRRGNDLDPVRLEIFNHQFRSLAEEMGYTLQKSAHSVNIKERLDFSCALFDDRGELIANAPHIPVHLGSMGDSVRSLIRLHGHRFHPGDVWLANSPYAGGTHLPDITVVTPLFDTAGSRILFYLASRGHHADVGGVSPGSMPPESRHIDEEGVISSGLRIVANGRLREEVIRDWLGSPPFPARNPDQNIADLSAQIAANSRGVEGLNRLIEHHSLATVQAYTSHLQSYAEACMRRVVSGLQGGEFSLQLDSGARIRVTIEVDSVRGDATIDFRGTSPQQPDNLNAPAAVARAAVLYVLRTLIPEDIPLNAGCLRPITIRLPVGSLLNPRPPAAIVAGNVETSQQIVDALYGALGVQAASQGTMNNLTFGNARYQYYETICGGSGGGRRFKGADAVQTHMTNSRLTDPEILEWRFPILLETFTIRQGSGGSGLYQGGRGVIRRMLFLEPMSAGILSNRRRVSPFGLAGGEPGQPGSNRLIRADGSESDLGPVARIEIQAGDRLEISTPGGGGYGAPHPKK